MTWSFDSGLLLLRWQNFLLLMLQSILFCSFVSYFQHFIFQPFLFLCLFINGLPNLSAQSQSDCETSSPLQTLDLTESLPIKLRPPVPPKPPPEIQVVWSSQTVKLHMKYSRRVLICQFRPTISYTDIFKHILYTYMYLKHIQHWCVSRSFYTLWIF